MTPIVERIETAGPDRKARRLVFSNQEEPRLTSAATIREIRLSVGDQVDLAALGECEVKCARERALRILGHRDRSVQELRSRLRMDGYPQHVVSPLLDRLIDLDLLDDVRFASSWARSRAASGMGRARIMTDLAAKGVDADVASTAVNEALQEYDPVETALRLMGNVVPVDRRERERLTRKLVRKGFDIDTIKCAIRRAEDAQ